MVKKGGILKEIFLVLVFIALFFLTSSGIDFLIWFVNVPLLILIYKKPIKSVLLLSSVSAIMAVFLSFTWVMNYDVGVYLFSSLIFSSFLIVFALIFNFMSKNIKGCLQIFVAPFVFSSLMVIYILSPVNSYWANWSMFNPLAAPLVWFVGSFGVTFIIILFHSALTFFLLERRKEALFAVIVVFLIMGASYVYSYNGKIDGEKVKVSLIQGNFPQSWEWRNENAKGVIFEEYEMLSLETASEQPDIIIWPEYAIADDFLKDSLFVERLANISINTNSYLVLGTVRFLDGFSGSLRNRNDVAIVFSPEGGIIGEYNSVSPLPFDKEVIKGNNLDNFETELWSFGISLCYEETQKEISRKLSDKGSDFLISMANEAVLDHSVGFNLISHYSTLRAAENGKYLLRATNTGITKIVNPYGKVEKSIEPYKRGILTGDIYLNSKTTFYSKYGDLILYVVLVLLGILFVRNFRK